MRVLLLSAYFPPDTGSASHLILDLGKALRDLGHDVSVLTTLPGYYAAGDLKRYRWRLWVREEVDGLNVFRVASPRLPRSFLPGRAVWQFGAAFSTLLAGLVMKRQEIAFVYSPPLPLGVTAWAIRMVRGTPFVFSVQDLFPHNLLEVGLLRRGRIFRLLEKLERFAYSRADWITVHAKRNADHVVRNGGSRERLTAMPNWVNTAEIHPDLSGEPFRRRHGLTNRFVVSFAGVLGHLQDIDVVLDAAELARERSEIVWLIVGDGVQKDRLESDARARGLENVIFMPMVPREDYPQVLYASDVCLATLKREVKTSVVPSKILSIMAAGKPVVTCLNLDEDGATLVREADCGYALPPGDPASLAAAVKTLCDDLELGAQLGANGRSYVERELSLEVAAVRLVKLFEQIAGRGAVSQPDEKNGSVIE